LQPGNRGGEDDPPLVGLFPRPRGRGSPRPRSPRRQFPPDIFDTHPAALDNTHFQRVFQNERVEVIRVRLGPREKTLVMEIPAHVMTCLTNQHLRLIYAHTKPGERAQKAGFTGWIERDEYGFENLEDKPVEWILVVPRGAEKSG
jgi:hypothetical protein